MGWPSAATGFDPKPVRSQMAAAAPAAVPVPAAPLPPAPRPPLSRHRLKPRAEPHSLRPRQARPAGDRGARRYRFAFSKANRFFSCRRNRRGLVDPIQVRELFLRVDELVPVSFTPLPPGPHSDRSTRTGLHESDFRVSRCVRAMHGHRWSIAKLCVPLCS